MRQFEAEKRDAAETARQREEQLKSLEAELKRKEDARAAGNEDDTSFFFKRSHF